MRGSIIPNRIQEKKRGGVISKDDYKNGFNSLYYFIIQFATILLIVNNSAKVTTNEIKQQLSQCKTSSPPYQKKNLNADLLFLDAKGLVCSFRSDINQTIYFKVLRRLRNSVCQKIR